MEGKEKDLTGIGSAASSPDKTLRSWRKLAATLQSIPPAGYLRFGLIVAAAAGLLWIAWQTRTALLPFILGGVIAYILLPLVNALDRLMPRFLAVLITMGGMLGFLAFLLYILIPPLAQQTPFLLQLLPDRSEIQGFIDQLRLMIQALPASTQETVIKTLQTVSLTLREYVDKNLNGLAGAVVLFLVTFFRSIGFFLGFLIVPAWLFSVLKDQRKSINTINRILPASFQEDFWAIAKIIDRPLRAYISGQFLLAVSKGFAVYLSLGLLEYLGWPPIHYKVPLAVWAAVFELIPEIGPYLGALPAVLGGFIQSPQAGLIVIALFVFLHYLVSQLVGSRIENRIIQIHPAILLVVIVALSQLGFIWVLVAAPLISILTNLFRYLYGRLSNPPAPAGILPGQPVPQAPASQETPVYRVPLVYQRGAKIRRSSRRM